MYHQQYIFNHVYSTFLFIITYLTCTFLYIMLATAALQLPGCCLFVYLLYYVQIFLLISNNDTEAFRNSYALQATDSQVQSAFNFTFGKFILDMDDHSIMLGFGTAGLGHQCKEVNYLIIIVFRNLQLCKIFELMI